VTSLRHPIHIEHRPDPGEAAARKGRGTTWAIAPRHAREQRQSIDDGWGSMDDDEAATAPSTVVIEQQAKSILTRNDSPDIAFELSVNPYRGCEHGCVYCFARPTQSYLDMSPGIDFETRIVAKMNAASLLRDAFTHPGYECAPLNIGSATDAYQPVERKLRITRAVLEVMAQFHHPLSMYTKSAGIERDIDILAPMAQRGLVAVSVSITTLDPALARILEPRAASPQRRLQTVERLAAAGIPVGVSVSPIIPFLNEPEIERILEAARQAGASRASSVVLRLPWEVNPLFQQWLEHHFPDRASRVMARLREMHGGRDYDASFRTRMKGEGVWARMLRQRLVKAAGKLGLGTEHLPFDTTQFSRPAVTAADAVVGIRCSPMGAQGKTSKASKASKVGKVWPIGVDSAPASQGHLFD
jgi:DNA repair photolyase